MLWYDIMLRVGFSALIGMIIGFQRELSGHPAGIKTHSIVCIGAAVASLIQLQILSDHPGTDPTRIIAQVVSGIGFIGAGCILHDCRSDKGIKGLTTASTLWVVACLGIAAGLGYYIICISALIAVIFILIVVSILIRHKKSNLQFSANDAEIDHTVITSDKTALLEENAIQNHTTVLEECKSGKNG